MTQTICKLCSKSHNEESYGVAYRTTEIRHGQANSGKRYVVSNWMYKPRLTEDELFILGRGEHNICTRRADCINRRCWPK